MILLVFLLVRENLLVFFEFVGEVEGRFCCCFFKFVDKKEGVVDGEGILLPLSKFEEECEGEKF